MRFVGELYKVELLKERHVHAVSRVAFMFLYFFLMSSFDFVAGGILLFTSYLPVFLYFLSEPRSEPQKPNVLF